MIASYWSSSAGSTGLSTYDVDDAGRVIVDEFLRSVSDPRIVAVVNPHPRMVRDPNRPRPYDIRTQLRAAFERVAAAGPMNRVDLAGVDPIRPVTFSFFP